MLFRFANFELDPQCAELRGPNGEAIKLRPKTIDMLTLFAANAGRVLSKQELMEEVWPDVLVGEDSLFQCIRELRVALGDDQRQMIKLVSGRGYLLDAEVSTGEVTDAMPARPAASATTQRRFRLNRRGVIGAAVGAMAIAGLAVAAPILAPDFFTRAPAPQTVAVMPIAVMGTEAQTAAMAAAVTTRLADGLGRIGTLRVVAPAIAGDARTTATYLVKGDLEKVDDAWSLRARVVTTASDEVQPVSPILVAIKDVDPHVQQSRLAAGVGHQLAARFNATLYRAQQAEDSSRGSAGRAAVQQAVNSINRTTRERFADAQTILEKALADDPDNIDVEVALAALKLRGIQLVWYTPAESIAAEASARSLLGHALRVKPNSIPVLEAYCRFLTATNEFVDSLVACARTLSFDPWNGAALYQLGLSQAFLGRFEDALETFKQADRYDTPEVSRWTWLLGAGFAHMLMGQSEQAVPWIQKSIAITPASGRPYTLLSAAYQRLGRLDEAKAAMAKGMALRPGSTVANIRLPEKNTSPVYREAFEGLLRTNVETGLPEH